MHAVTSHVAYFKKTVMHLRNHCAYVHFTGLTHALRIHGNSAIDHLHLRATLPSTFFDTYEMEPTTTSLEVNLYLLYDIIRRATSYRCQRIRLRWRDHTLHISFETDNKRDVYQLACRLVDDTSPLLPHVERSEVSDLPCVRVDAAQLHRALLRFDDDTFTAVTLSIRPHALVLKSKTDAMRGRVKLPVTPRTTRHKCGTFALADLLLTTRFGLLSADKMVRLAPVAYADDRAMLHVRFALWAGASVDVLFPKVSTQLSPTSDSSPT